MSTPGRIPIGDARRVARERDVPMLVMFAIHPDGQEFTVTTYGMTKKLCKLAAAYGDRIADGVLQGKIAAPQTEPEGYPESPATWEGVSDG
jgi:hypothetical protein